MLISYTPIEDDELAEANVWNTRFSKIHDVINGNIDDMNLKNESIKNAKLAPQSITEDKLVAGMLLPIGSVIDYAGTTAPAGWLVCNGSALSRNTYSKLFAAIGTTWGAGNGTSTFNLPDLARRATVGSGGTGTATLGNAVGNKGGEENHTLTVAEMPSHGHSLNIGDKRNPWLAPNFVINYQYQEPAPLADSGGIENEGGGLAHNNLPPSAVILKIIRAE